MVKIGMCCACGDQVNKSQTLLVGGLEYCRHCAEMLGFDADDEDES
jgi:predicted amidophosphoribosyltransferase